MAHTTAGGNRISDHAEDHMYDRHITDWQVDLAISDGWTQAGNRQGRTEHHYEYGRGMCLLVVTADDDGTVVTTLRHRASRHR
jgi:hypothetical protein